MTNRVSPPNSAVSGSGSALSRDAEADRHGVLAALGALDAALLAKDASAILDLLDTDFVGVVPSGLTLARGAYVVFHTRPDEGLVSIEPAAGEPVAVRLFDGGFAVVNRRASVRRANGSGQVEAFDVQRIEVLRLDAGRWRIVSGQGTRVMQTPQK